MTGPAATLAALVREVVVALALEDRQRSELLVVHDLYRKGLKATHIGWKPQGYPLHTQVTLEVPAGAGVEEVIALSQRLTRGLQDLPVSSPALFVRGRVATPRDEPGWIGITHLTLTLKVAAPVLEAHDALGRIGDCKAEEVEDFGVAEQWRMTRAQAWGLVARLRHLAAPLKALVDPLEDQQVAVTLPGQPVVWWDRATVQAIHSRQDFLDAYTFHASGGSA